MVENLKKLFMLKTNQKVAIYMEGHIHSEYGKMGMGVLRYLENKIVCVIDSKFSNSNINDHYPNLKPVPIVNDLESAIQLEAEVLILGIAPSGGKVPSDWYPIIKLALSKGLSIINGLHDLLENRFRNLITKKNQWIWDVRVPNFVPEIATGKAAKLNNKRLLMVGTDMACGKMTTALEVLTWSKKNKLKSGFIATGQIGITITGDGIPLDAFKVDHACGAVERKVLEYCENDLIIIEGQGSLLHPGSTATLPLIRGSCPTHLILCHRAEKQNLRYPENIKIPNLKKFIELNENLAHVFGSFPLSKCIGVSLNTSKLDENEAKKVINETAKITGLPVTDPVRYGVDEICLSLLSY